MGFTPPFLACFASHSWLPFKPASRRAPHGKKEKHTSVVQVPTQSFPSKGLVLAFIYNLTLSQLLLVDPSSLCNNPRNKHGIRVQFLPTLRPDGVQIWKCLKIVNLHKSWLFFCFLFNRSNKGTAKGQLSWQPRKCWQQRRGWTPMMHICECVCVCGVCVDSK